MPPPFRSWATPYVSLERLAGLQHARVVSAPIDAETRSGSWLASRRDAPTPQALEPPEGLEEAPEQEAHQRDEAQGIRGTPKPIQLRHEREIHAVDTGDRRRPPPDERPPPPRP